MIYGATLASTSTRLARATQSLGLNFRPAQSAYASIILVLAFIVILILDYISSKIDVACKGAQTDANTRPPIVTSAILAMTFPSVANTANVLAQLKDTNQK